MQHNATQQKSTNISGAHMTLDNLPYISLNDVDGVYVGWAVCFTFNKIMRLRFFLWHFKRGGKENSHKSVGTHIPKLKHTGLENEEKNPEVTVT